MRKKIVFPYHHPSWLSPAEALRIIIFPLRRLLAMLFCPVFFFYAITTCLYSLHMLTGKSFCHQIHLEAFPSDSSDIFTLNFLSEAFSDDAERCGRNEETRPLFSKKNIWVNKCLWGTSCPDHQHHAIWQMENFLFTDERKHSDFHYLLSSASLLPSSLPHFHADVKAKPKNHKHMWSRKGATHSTNSHMAPPCSAATRITRNNFPLLLVRSFHYHASFLLKVFLSAFLRKAKFFISRKASSERKEMMENFAVYKQSEREGRESFVFTFELRGGKFVKIA